MRSFAALSLILLSTFTSASSVITLPLTKLQQAGSYLKGSPGVDRARAAFLKGRAYNGQVGVPATNLAYVQYTASVGIGNPPTYYNLIVDTGSSNTFCGAGAPYVRTSTSIHTGEAVNVTYGSGYFTGMEYLDQVTLAPHLVITNQSIGDARSFAGFSHVDGIIGLGPVDRTQGTLLSHNNATIPTVMNNLISQGYIKKQILGVYFSPPTNYSDTNGALTFGGVNPHLYKGDLMYVPVTKTYPASMFWGVNITSCTYGHYSIIPTSTAGIVDTGTSLVLLADDLLSVYIKAIPGAKLDPATDLIEIPKSSISSMQDLKFAIADQVFIMDVAAQLLPTDQNTALGGVSGKQYGLVSNIGNNSGGGFDFVLGQKFIERYYTVFDTDNERVGFARTNNTFTTYQG